MPAVLYFSLITGNVVGLIAILRYKKLSTPLRYLGWYIVFIGVAEWLEFFLAYHRIHNLWLFHFTTPIELFILSGVFYHWRKNKRDKSVILLLLTIYMIVWIVGLFSFEPLEQSNNYTMILCNLLEIVFAVILLMGFLNENQSVWHHDARFWVATGVVMYAAATMFLFGLFNVLLASSLSTLRMWSYFNWMISIVTYLFFLRAFFCKPEPVSAAGQGSVAGSVV
jgi:hypothetical protein